MMRLILIFAGTLSLALGIVGVFVPGLPTTPFILLTAGLYVRSSPALHNKLKNHWFTGPYLERFSKGLSFKTRLFSVLLMWTMIIPTSLFLLQSVWSKVILICVGITGTLFNLWFLREKKKK